MSELGFSLGVPNAMPAGGVGQKPYSNPQKRDQKQKDRKAEDAQNNAQHLLLTNHDHGQQDGAPYGKGDLVDIIA